MKALVTCVALLATTTCTTSGGTQSSSTARPAGPSPASSVASGGRPTCDFISFTRKEYGSHIEPMSGEAGETVEVFGPTYRGENHRFAPSKRLEVWWNTRVPQTQVAGANPIDGDSPILLLATAQNMDRCHFRTQFRVPDVPSGTYKIRTFVFTKSGYGWFGRHHFSVECRL
jgi:hypothetical protein